MADVWIGPKADLYTLDSGDEVVWERLDVDWAQPSGGLKRRDLLHCLIPQPCPEELSGWQYELLDLSDEEYRSMARPHGIETAAFDALPDIFDWLPALIVRTHVRDMLEELFPDGSLFFPLTVCDPEAGETVVSDRWSWIPRHRLRLKEDRSRGSERRKRPTCRGPLGNERASWEVAHNPAFHRLADTLPFWGTSPRYADAVFRSDVFRSLRKAGVTGLNPAPEDNYLRYRPTDTVGYLRFVR